jgi:hypothetical protein
VIVLTLTSVEVGVTVAVKSLTPPGIVLVITTPSRVITVVISSVYWVSVAKRSMV